MQLVKPPVKARKFPVVDALAKVNRDEQGGPLLGRTAFRKQCRLLRVLLTEMRDHYLTLPLEVRAATEQYLGN